MAHPSIARRGRAALAAGLGLLLALAGCAKKPTAVDPAYVPEGIEDGAARLIAWPNLPVLVNASVREEGSIIVTPLVSQLSFGAPRGPRLLILDSSVASEFALYRSTADQGAVEALPFTLKPFARWPDRQWDAFEHLVEGADPAGRYRGLGLVEGVRTRNSPLTNLATADVTPTMFGVQLVHGDPAGVTSNYTDSLFTLRWDAVPGAANYVVHVFQPQSDARAPDVLASAIPGPLTIGKTRDQFLALLPGTVTQYRLGDPGGIVLARGKTFMGQAYLARMSALDAQGRVIGIGVPRTTFAGEAVYGLLDFTQSEVEDRLPPELASRIVEEAFAVAPDAVVTFDLLALSVQTQAKLPDLETYVRVFRPPYDPGVWNPAGPAARVLVAPRHP